MLLLAVLVTFLVLLPLINLDLNLDYFYSLTTGVLRTAKCEPANQKIGFLHVHVGSVDKSE